MTSSGPPRDPDSIRYTVEEATRLLQEIAPLLEVLRGRHGLTNGARPPRPEQVLARLHSYGIAVRDIETGLVDFPSERDGRKVWLCWRLGEPEIAWWHETTEGAAHRKPL
jgi:hypothetical protein